MRKALKGCVSGSISDKTYVKNLIGDLLTRSIGLNKSNVDEVILFAEPDLLTIQDRFEIVFYLYRQQFGVDALSRMIDTYDLGRLRMEEGTDDGGSYYISEEDIQYVFECEYRELGFREKTDIIVQRIYQHYKGFSVVDEIRDQRIDGVSGGVSGMLDAVHNMGLQNRHHGMICWIKDWRMMHMKNRLAAWKVSGFSIKVSPFIYPFCPSAVFVN